MSMLEIHRSALEEAIVPLHEFYTAQRKAKKRIYGFVEGRDDPAYYQGHIDLILDNQEWELKVIEAGYPKGNREKVLRLYNMIDWNKYSPMQTAFFIDRDLSDYYGESIPNADNIYVTDSYSIENNIVNIYTIKRVIQEIFHISLFDYEMEKMSDLFHKGYENICQLIELITCCYICLRKNEKKPNFNDVDLGKVCSIKNCEVNVVSEGQIIKYLQDKWNTTFDMSDIYKVKKEFAHLNENNKLIRGKFLSWYFIRFLKSFSQECNNIISRLEKPLTHIRELSDKYFIDDFGMRSMTPKSLREFVERTYRTYVNLK